MIHRAVSTEERQSTVERNSDCPVSSAYWVRSFGVVGAHLCAVRHGEPDWNVAGIPHTLHRVESTDTRMALPAESARTDHGICHCSWRADSLCLPAYPAMKARSGWSGSSLH